MTEPKSEPSSRAGTLRRKTSSLAMFAPSQTDNWKIWPRKHSKSVSKGAFDAFRHSETLSREFDTKKLSPRAATSSGREHRRVQEMQVRSFGDVDDELHDMMRSTQSLHAVLDSEQPRSESTHSIATHTSPSNESSFCRSSFEHGIATAPSSATSHSHGSSSHPNHVPNVAPAAAGGTNALKELLAMQTTPLWHTPGASDTPRRGTQTLGRKSSSSSRKITRRPRTATTTAREDFANQQLHDADNPANWRAAPSVRSDDASSIGHIDSRHASSVHVNESHLTGRSSTEWPTEEGRRWSPPRRNTSLSRASGRSTSRTRSPSVTPASPSRDPRSASKISIDVEPSAKVPPPLRSASAIVPPWQPAKLPPLPPSSSLDWQDRPYTTSPVSTVTPTQKAKGGFISTLLRKKRSVTTLGSSHASRLEHPVPPMPALPAGMELARSNRRAVTESNRLSLPTAPMHRFLSTSSLSGSSEDHNGSLASTDLVSPLSANELGRLEVSSTASQRPLPSHQSSTSTLPQSPLGQSPVEPIASMDDLRRRLQASHPGPASSKLSAGAAPSQLRPDGSSRGFTTPLSPRPPRRAPRRPLGGKSSADSEQTSVTEQHRVSRLSHEANLSIGQQGSKQHTPHKPGRSLSDVFSDDVEGGGGREESPPPSITYELSEPSQPSTPLSALGQPSPKLGAQHTRTNSEGVDTGLF